jgi:hypothetical protein
VSVDLNQNNLMPTLGATKPQIFKLVAPNFLNGIFGGLKMIVGSYTDWRYYLRVHPIVGTGCMRVPELDALMNS